MSVLEELQAAVAVVARQVGPRRSSASAAPARLGRDRRRRSRRHERPQPARRRGHRTLRRWTIRPGRVAGVDVDGDLAVVDGRHGRRHGRSNGATARPSASAPRSSARRPRPAAAPRVTVGIVSASRARSAGRVAGASPASIEHTAPLASGSSGGALVDAAGRLVGLNTNRVGEGFYLALPADAALRERVDALGRGESPRSPAAGHRGRAQRVASRMRQSVGLPERDGLLVRGVEDDSPAAQGGHPRRRPHRRGRRARR